MSFKPFSKDDIKKNIIDPVLNKSKKRPSFDGGNQGSAKRKPFFGKKAKKPIKLYIAPECYTIPITGVNVSLPLGLEPYRTQKLMMVRILQALQKSQNALAESPTGSGKTMALLASTCAWLRQYKERRNQSREQCQLHSSAEYTAFKENEISNLLKEETTPIDPIPSSSAFNDDDECSIIYDKFDQSMHKLIENVDDDFIPAKKPSNTKASDLAKLMAAEDDVVEASFAQEKKELCTCLPRVRIYYGTRTHKQIGQVVKEFGRLDYAPSLTHTILGSREQMCINEDTRKHPDVTAACKELIGMNGLGCQFKTNMRGNFEKGPQVRQVVRSKGVDVFDIEALVEALGDDDGPQICPYFSATRVLTQDADIVFCPFNYMIDPIIRDSSDVHLKDSVVVLDEAHNVEDICRDAASFTFAEKEIHDSLMSYNEKHEMAKKELSEQSRRLSEDANENMVDYIVRLKEFVAAIQKLVVMCTDIREWLIDVSEGVPSPKIGDKFGKGTTTKGWEVLWMSLQDDSHSRRLLFMRDSNKFKEYQEALGKMVEKEGPEVKNWTMENFRPSGTAIVCVEKFLYFLFYFTKEDRRSMFRLNITVERPTEAQLSAEQAHSRRGGQGGDYGMTGGPRNQLYSSQATYGSSTVTSSTVSNGLELWNTFGASSFVDPKAMPHSFNPIRPGLRITAHMWCMSPELAFMDAFADCRSVVLASGTLCPTETLKTELGMPFNMEMEGEQVIPREQIFAAVVSKGPSGQALRATFQNSNDDRFIDELGRIVRSVAFTVPSGVLVFLPSYRLLDRLYDYMHRSTLLKQVEMRKVVVREPRRSSELNDIMSQYEAGIADPTRFGPRVTGSLMFAVFRGKVSEGIDFTDDRARCVISVGIPYPNAMDELVLEKKKYNNENSTKLRILNGDQWYTSQAYRALNQALGRCLRHRGDWGAIVMVDERLIVSKTTAVSTSSTFSAARVSRWIRDQAVNYSAYNEFEANLATFVQNMSIANGKKVIVKEDWEE